MQAFTEVDKHFREIFANLSDGDGFLQLENPNSPLEGGLTLVAHPKGKNVRRLASMSGGEKSLTALSFLFALQKYKPSPFYALDEVDSFLDGINVERLSKLITNQSSNAQFIVVSHRRPMISLLALSRRRYNGSTDATVLTSGKQPAILLLQIVNSTHVILIPFLSYCDFSVKCLKSNSGHFFKNLKLLSNLSRSVVRALSSNGSSIQPSSESQDGFCIGKEPYPMLSSRPSSFTILLDEALALTDTIGAHKIHFSSTFFSDIK